jgi:hypothetical protein
VCDRNLQTFADLLRIPCKDRVNAVWIRDAYRPRDEVVAVRNQYVKIAGAQVLWEYGIYTDVPGMYLCDGLVYGTTLQWEFVLQLHICSHCSSC